MNTTAGRVAILAILVVIFRAFGHHSLLWVKAIIYETSQRLTLATHTMNNIYFSSNPKTQVFLKQNNAVNIADHLKLI